MAQQTDGERRLRDMREWGLPLGVVASVVGMTIWAMEVVREEAQALGQRIGSVEWSVQLAARDITEMSHRLNGGLTQAQAMAWIAVFRAANPNLSVPDLPPK